MRHLFGVAANQKIEKVTVKWPNGDEQKWGHLQVDNYWRLVESEKEAKPTARASK